jgi:mannitol operon transcriptional antiterminator
MIALTTRQRDIVKLLIELDAPLGAAELAAQMKLTARQVNYNLEGVARWLSDRQIAIKVTPGVGIELDCSPDQSSALIQELNSESPSQIVLTSGQRRQLLAVTLLNQNEPLILHHLHRLLRVSRTTVIKDASSVVDWMRQFDLDLARRQNYGLLVVGREQRRRQALAALLWGQAPFGEPLFEISYSSGLAFLPAADADLLPVLQLVRELTLQVDISRIFGQVAYAEAQLGGRFTDDAALHLALVFAIQAVRVHGGNFVNDDTGTLAWMKTLGIWPVAAQIGQRLGWRLHAAWPESEIAAIGMYLLASARDERWPGDLEIDSSFAPLIDEIMRRAGEAYALPGLVEDRTLRDGLVNNVLPACLAQRFQLWLPPPPPSTALSAKYAFERELARDLADLIDRQVGVILPESEINNLALLLRASYIRERPQRTGQVLVVCPSGMATAQLLVARLKAQFPRIGPLKVVSLRELSKEISAASELIITTVPLPLEIQTRSVVIQVHPLLSAEDIETIKNHLT